MKQKKQESTVHSIVERLKAAYEVGQWARANGFDSFEIMWHYESTVEEIIEVTRQVGAKR